MWAVFTPGESEFHGFMKISSNIRGKESQEKKRGGLSVSLNLISIRTVSQFILLRPEFNSQDKNSTYSFV